MRRNVTFLSVLLFFIPALLHAQKGSISGFLFDSTQTPVSYASVAVFDLRDSTVVNFGLTDDRGGFELRSLPPGIPLRLLISHVLYHPRLENFRLDSNETKQLDTLWLNEKNNEFAETVVTWEAPPIVVRNDTVEFNADAFIGRPGSAVEELLKRIPGVEIADDGQITYNGRRVSKITVDSKQFFGDDPVILMKNIPAKAIQKVQVTEEKDERGRITETGNVSINLTLKPWAKKSHFGKAYAGYGSDQRYESGAMWNFLRDTLQISLIGYGNNLSQSGFSFSDLYRMGGFNRSGVNYVSFSDNTIGINGASFGGGQGITESGGGGFNLNYDLPRKWSVSSSYFIGLTRTTYNEDTQSERYFGDTTLSVVTQTKDLAKSSNHTFNAKFKWTPDTVHLFTWSPKLTINGGKENNTRQNSNAFSYLPDRTQIGNTLANTTKGVIAGNELGWDMALKRWSYELSTDQSYQDETGLGINQILTQTITDTAIYGQNQFQERESETKGLFFNTSGGIRFKVNDSLSFRFIPTVNHSNTLKRVMVYELDSNNSENVFIPTLSTQFHEERTSYSGALGMSKRIGKAWLSARVTMHRTDIVLENQLSGSGLKRDFQYPEISLSYGKNTPTSYVDVDYSYTTELPYSSQLIDLTDNSNPNYIQVGNPNLNPERLHEISTWARKANENDTWGAQWSGRARVTQNGIIRENFFDESGRSVSRPRNLASDEMKSYIGAWLYLFISKETSKKWKHSPSVYLSGNTSRSWQYLNASSYQMVSYTLRPAISYNILKKDYFDAKVSFNPTWTNSQTLGLSNPVNNRYAAISAEIWWAPVEKYWLEVKGVYTRQASSNPAVETREFTLVNAAFTRLVLKENRGQIRLSVFDLLNQNRAINQYAEGSYVSTSISNAVTRYFMLSFVYNYNSFQKTGRQQRGFSFWH